MSSRTQTIKDDKRIDEIILTLIKEVGSIRNDRVKTPDEFFNFSMTFIDFFSVNFIANTLLALNYPKDKASDLVDELIGNLCSSMKSKLKEALDRFDKKKVH